MAAAKTANNTGNPGGPGISGGAKRPARLLNLDLLRLVSALMVLAYHYGFRMGNTGDGGGAAFPELAPLAIWFDAGLLIFFAISGYVIALSAENRTAYDFAAGRLARLWPTFVLCATVTALVMHAWPFPGMEPPGVKQWLAHFVILSRALGEPFLDGAYWTIAYEIIFYGWVFVLIASGGFARHWRGFVLAWLLVSVANEGLIDSGILRKLLITQYSGYFAFGLALFRTQREPDAASWPVVALAGLWACATPFIVEPLFVAAYGVERSVWGLCLMGPFALAAVTLCATARTLPVPPGLAIGLGGLTYPLYLLHQNIGYSVFTRFGPEFGRWPVAVALLAGLLLLAWLLARFWEPPARRAIVAASRRLRARLGGVMRHEPA